MNKMFKKHPLLSILCIILIFLLICLPFSPLNIEYNPYFSNIYNFILTTSIALIVYLLVDTQTSEKLNAIQKIENNIQENIKELNKSFFKMKSYVDRTYFQTERSVALNKYPETKQFEKINNAYQPFIFSLFDEGETNIL